MAVSWGSAKGTGNKFRVGIDIKIPTPTVSDTSVTITVDYWFWSKDALNDASISLTKSGNGANAGTVTVAANTPSNSDWSKSNKKLVRTETKVIATSSVDQVLTVTASMTGVDEANAATVATHTEKGTLKKSPLAQPDAPTGCATTRNSDTSQTITWTNVNPTATTKRYLGINVERWDNVANKWYALKTLGVVTSFTDTTTIKDREYQYRVRSFNGGGKSGWSTSAKRQTSPAAPTNVDVTRPASNALVTWKNISTIVASYSIRHWLNGVDQGVIATGISPTATSWSHSGATITASHRYAIIPVADLEGAQSAQTPLLPASGPPLAPSGLWPNGTIHAASEALTLSWVHAAVDGSSQTARKVRLYEVGDGELYPTQRTLTATASGTTNQLSAVGHMLNDGDPVTPTGGTIPSPLVLDVTYYAVVDSASAFRLASSEEDAEDGIVLDLAADSAGLEITNPVSISNASALTLPADTLEADRVYQWSVATKGAYSDAQPLSPWSPMASFRTASTPTTTIAFPEDGGTTMSPSAMVGWAFYSADEGVVQQWWEASLWQGGALLESMEGEGDWGTYSFVYDLQNGTEYRVEVITEGSNGVRSEVASSTFTPEFVGPIAPGIELTWDADDGYVEIDITNPTDIDSPDAFKNVVEHSLPGGKWSQIAKDVPPDTTIIHFLPTPNVVNNYRIRATSADGATTVSNASISCDNSGDWYWLNGGTAFDVIAKARYSGGVDIDLELDKELHEFAGRTRPVEYSGTIVRQEIEISAQFPRDPEGYQSMAEFEALVRTPGTVYYRDMVGRRLKCSLSKVSFSDSENLIDFTAKLTESD